MLLYIDPGSGSYVAQVIIAALLGIAFYFRSAKAYLLSFFKKKKKEEQDHS
jgi:hypothetical protein